MTARDIVGGVLVGLALLLAFAIVGGVETADDQRTEPIGATHGR